MYKLGKKNSTIKKLKNCETLNIYNANNYGIELF